MCTVFSQTLIRKEECSDGGDGDGKSNVVRHTITFPEFWSRRSSWSPGCCIAANLKIDQYSCQIQVFPTGRGILRREDEDEFELLEIQRKEEEDEDEIVVVLVNTSGSDLHIDGEGSFGEENKSFSFVLKNKILSKVGDLVLLHMDSLDRGTNCLWERDLSLVVEFSAKEVSPDPDVKDTENTHEEKSLLGSNTCSLSEINENVRKVNPMIASLRDQVMEGMESMQDILLESPLRKEITDLRKDLGSMKAELSELMNDKMNIQGYRGLQESVDEIMRDVAGVEKSNRSGQAQVKAAIFEMKEEILHSIGNLKDQQRGATAPDANTMSAISEVKYQLELLQDSVLAAVSSPPPVYRPVYPECPYCMEEFLPAAEILQCVSGHLICQSCRAKPNIRDCPSCHQHFTGRNRGLEAFLLKLREG